MLRTILNAATFGVLALVLMTGAGRSLAAPEHAEAAAEVVGQALDGVQTLIVERIAEQEDRSRQG